MGVTFRREAVEARNVPGAWLEQPSERHGEVDVRWWWGVASVCVVVAVVIGAFLVRVPEDVPAVVAAIEGDRRALQVSSQLRAVPGERVQVQTESGWESATVVRATDGDAGSAGRRAALVLEVSDPRAVARGVGSSVRVRLRTTSLAESLSGRWL